MVGPSGCDLSYAPTSASPDQPMARKMPLVSGIATIKQRSHCSQARLPVPQRTSTSDALRGSRLGICLPGRSCLWQDASRGKKMAANGRCRRSLGEDSSRGLLHCSCHVWRDRHRQAVFVRVLESRFHTDCRADPVDSTKLQVVIASGSLSTTEQPSITRYRPGADPGTRASGSSKVADHHAQRGVIAPAA